MSLVPMIRLVSLSSRRSANTFSLHLTQFERDLTAHPQITVSQTLREDSLQL